MTVVCPILEEFLDHGEGRRTEAGVPNGTRVFKTIMEPGDGTPIGMKGTVLGSTLMPPSNPPGVGYLIRWDGPPSYEGFITDRKLAVLEEE